MHSNSLPGSHNIDNPSDDEETPPPGDYDTESENDNDDQEQTQDDGEFDDGEDEDDQGYEEEDGEGEEEEEVAEDDDQSERLYVVDMLRQTKVDWLTYPQYSTHRLIVVRDDTITSTKDESPGVFNVMDHFLIPASAIFRDFFLYGKPAEGEGRMDQEEDDEARANRMHQIERLSCLEALPHSQVLPAADTTNVEPFLPPSPGPAPLWILNLLYSSAASTEPGSKPSIQLKLPAPEHFSALLQVIYDGDMEQWQQTTFSPTSIAPILQNVLRLQCSASFVICCLEYYRSIRDQIEPATMETGKDSEAWQQLWDMFDRAVLSGLLPPDPEASPTVAPNQQDP